MNKSSYAIAVVAVLVVAVAGWFGWRESHPAAPPPVAEEPPSVLPVTPSAPASAPVDSAPEIRHPIEAQAAAASAPPDVDSELVELFGRRAVLTMFHVDDFAQRFVATVDNLGQASASPRLWPLAPAGGRFAVEAADGGAVVAISNGERYAPYVRLIEGVDLRTAVATYVRLYPLFQKAYADLGYPKRYFNDRLIEVIDLLLATPEPTAPLKVHQPVFAGPTPPVRPWVLYEFDDPALQSLSAGQRILLRTGPDNERGIKARLATLRDLLVAAEPRAQR